MVGPMVKGVVGADRHEGPAPDGIASGEEKVARHRFLCPVAQERHRAGGGYAAGSKSAFRTQTITSMAVMMPTTSRLVPAFTAMSRCR